MDRFSAINVFRRVVELGAFSAAARDLGLSNAAVSKMVKELEADLGVQLIVRTTRSLSLTDVGEAYFQRITNVLDDLSEADETARSSNESPRGRLRISAPMSLGLTVLSGALPAFAKGYPDLEIDIVMSDAYVDLIDGGFDLAIRGGQLEDSSLRARKLMNLDRIVCAAPEYLERNGRPASPSELSGHAALIFSFSASPNVWRLEKGGEREEVSVNKRYRANSSLAIRDAALQGLGLALLPLVYVDDALRSGELVDALPGWKGEPQAVYAVYPAHRESSCKLRLFIDFLIDAFDRRT